MTIRVYKDGDQWCALLGDDLQSGLAGFGQTPIAALVNFAQGKPDVLSEEHKAFFDWSIGQTSDGYHTFDELYQHRNLLYLAFLYWYSTEFGGWRSKKHHDGSAWEGWFIVGATVLEKQISYHLPIELWDYCDFLMAYEEAPEPFDGHTSEDVLKRLKEFLVVANGGFIDSRMNESRRVNG